MIGGAARRIGRALSLHWLTGPILSKELRVSSRRRRNYWLRFGYLVLLTLYVGSMWMTLRSFSGSQVYTVSRMAMVGRMVTSTVAGVQFVAMQLIAVIMLSTSISEEIHHRTLGVLMTTPTSSLQVVFGKMFSKLWQLFILLAVSLPLLAVVRVFGGVPWDFVVSSLCITTSAMIFAAALSMYFSVRSRHSYAVILKTLAVAAIVFGVVPAVGFMLAHDGEPEVFLTLLGHVNPYFAYVFNQLNLFSPASSPPGFFSWPLHCGIMLGGGMLLLLATARVVRRVALRLATGERPEFVFRKRRAKKAARTLPPRRGQAPEPVQGRIGPVIGRPVMWKELRCRFLKGGRRAQWIAWTFSLATLALTYVLCGESLVDGVAHVVYPSIFLFLGLVVTIVGTSTAITSEKESRCWPVLLCTPLSDWDILLGKLGGVLYKFAPIWIFLVGHLVLFSLLGLIHPIALVQMPMVVIPVVVFVACSGLFFSALFRHSASAVAANLILALALWMVLPWIVAIFVAISNAGEEALELWVSSNPMAETVIVMEATGGRENTAKLTAGLSYDWPGNYEASTGATFLRLVGVMSAYMLGSALLLGAAKERLRRKI